ncbi:carbohydrate ABC transporter permease [Rhizobium sophoriradicis]|uniref:Maltose/maltodextrin transport system permease protein MalG n=1 Tax=Rhizobium etli bv. mimosae str. IE4771 TaxID=1432050 RepID=A0A060I9Z9_RHIET|nr:MULTISPECIES: carbohydrate ABC transporter permease [Rhizobium]AJC83722.1 sugar ABC transporter permease protein [Rhizobium etli bv. phaseoli str. IE4803]UWU37183.1 carbohydrate ABC transporter permease [Rhizobium leguminosarum bv. phaseoli]AIC31763.1 sugar ABC transporter permease protein [Rhizobium sp. IE4771]ARQ62502.1 sugar ABC transporter permease protein [Rhizobium sp. Kim5]RSC21220.1 carbohydrate ABC transporter permease [Rhizobium sophoriradicis]
MHRASRPNVSGVLINAAALVLVLSYALPYIYLLMTSIKPAADVQQIPPSFFPAAISFENFREVLQSSTLPRAFANSLTVAVLTTALSLLVAVPAAYVATQYRRRITTLFLLFALVTRMVPSVSLGVPLFQLLKSMGLLDTIPGLVLAHTSAAVPLALLLMSAFFEGVPRELEEAARMDGCTRFQAFRKIILPIMTGGIAVTALFTFITSWNEFLYALLLTSESTKTAPIVIAEYNSVYGLAWGAMTAAAVLYSLPVIIVTLALQKQIVGGLTFGAVKG